MTEETQSIMVSIRCLVYNHEPYLRQCLDGFVMQETNFRYEAIVHDDASTDNSASIIREYAEKYPNIIKPIYETENQYSKHDGSLRHIMDEACKGKYIAMCEGDDYWTDPNKLQKQVDYLEEREDYGMVYTSYRIQNDMTSDEEIVRTLASIPHDNNFKWRLLEQKVLIGTCTVLIRTQLLHTIRAIKDDYKGFMMGDTQTWFNAARLSNIGYIPDVTGVYRKQYTGATATFDPLRRANFIRGCLDLHLHLSYKYGASLDTIHIIKNLFGIPCFSLYLRIGDYEGAKKLNRDFFYDNKCINHIINMVRKMKVREIRGLSYFLRALIKIGVINLD